MLHLQKQFYLKCDFIDLLKNGICYRFLNVRFVLSDYSFNEFEDNISMYLFLKRTYFY